MTPSAAPVRPALVSPTHVPVRLAIVREGDGAPVPVVDVALHPTTEWGTPSRGRPLPAPAFAATDQQGLARFLLPPGEYAVVVREDDHETRRRLVVEGRTDATISVPHPPAGGRELLEVRVERARVPVAGVVVRLTAGPAPAREAVTDDDGRALMWLRPGVYTLACGPERATVDHRGASLLVFALAAAPLRDEEWRLAPEDLPFAVAEGPPGAAALRSARPLAPAHDLQPSAGERWVAGPPDGTRTARVRVR